jgi:nucleotide-binding universal stress UspA family protein
VRPVRVDLPLGSQVSQVRLRKRGSTYTKILVPLDGSKLSESVLPYVRALAKAFKIPVELLHAIDPEIVSASVDPSAGRYLDEVEADMRRKGLEYLEPVADSFRELATASCSTVVGKPAEMIVKIGAADPAILIAMASHSRSGIQRWLLGSVANKVLYTTKNPLLLVCSHKEMESGGSAPLKRVIVPLDGWPLAEKVLPHVVALAKKADMEILLLGAYCFPAGEVYAFGRTLAADERRDLYRYLDRIEHRLAREGLTRVFTLALECEAEGHIIDIARKTPDSLVAMCTYDRSEVARFVLESVTERVVRHSGNPVLIIHSEKLNQGVSI